MERQNKFYAGAADPIAAGWIRRPGPDFWLWRFFWLTWRWIRRLPIDAKAVRNMVVVLDSGNPNRNKSLPWLRKKELFHVKRHSDYGFDWGISDGGCLDLARSILADFLGEQDILIGNDGDGPTAVGVSDLLYNEFHLAVVSAFDRERFEYSGQLLTTWLETQGIYFAPDHSVRIHPWSPIGQLVEKRTWIQNYFPASDQQIEQLIEIVEKSNVTGPGAKAILGIPFLTVPGPDGHPDGSAYDWKQHSRINMRDFLTYGKAARLIRNYGPLADKD